MFKKIMVMCAVLVGPWVTFSGAAFAQSQQCAPYPDLASHLISQFGEVMVWQGNATPEAMVQLWSNADTETWTVLVYRADGLGCFMASGTGLETYAPPPAGTEG
jgi:hypothetical protein